MEHQSYLAPELKCRHRIAPLPQSKGERKLRREVFSPVISTCVMAAYRREPAAAMLKPSSTPLTIIAQSSN